MATSSISEFAPSVKSERLLHELIKEGALDDRVTKILLPENAPLEYEGALWDYKSKFPNVSGKHVPNCDEPDDCSVASIIKDVVAFHNSFGGYIIGGISEFDSDPIVGCRNIENFAFSVEKLNDRIKGYTRKDIKCRFKSFRLKGSSGSDVCVGILHVPQRKPDDPVIKMAKGAPEKNGKQEFQKNDVFARIDDKAISARNDHRIIPFLCSRRVVDSSELQKIVPLANNLPPRDPNLVEFVGRHDYLAELWAWMVERNAPLKILTAVGGTGKTTIAHEFCNQLVHSRPVHIDNVIWLSAKKLIFSAIQGKYEPAGRVDFYDIPSFFEALAGHCGAVKSDIQYCDDVNDLLDLTIDHLNILPAFIVVDDIDTLSLEQQGELFFRLQTLSGQTFQNGSRVLVTSRLEFGSVSQRITVEGFPRPEFKEFVGILSKKMKVAISGPEANQLWNASLGSPIFASSIFRLASFGRPVHAAIKDWKGRAGEDVRRFAFEREIEQLSDAECRTLLALVILGETSQVELAQVLEIDQQRLLEHLAKIREFHLFATSDALISGSKLTVPAPIILMIELIKKRVSDPKRIEKECARARSKSPKISDSTSYYFNQIIALWKEESHDEALVVAEMAAKNYPGSGDLPCLLGRCYLQVDPPQPTNADRAFMRALENGCTRLELASFWIEAKRLLGDWVGISEIADRVPQADIRGATALSVVLAEAQLGLQAVERRDYGKAKIRFKNSIFAAQKSIAQGRADEALPEIRELAREAARRYVALVDHISVKPGDRLDVFNAVSDAFECHISEASLMSNGAVALMNWAQDVFGRRPRDNEALDILAEKIDRLSRMIEFISNEPFDRSRLVSDLEKVRDRLSSDLSANWNS